MRLAQETNYITQKPCRSATNWLPPLWECFPFKQTRSCRRWRRVCKGVKETAVLNESVETGELPAFCLLFGCNHVLNGGVRVCLNAYVSPKQMVLLRFRAGCGFEATVIQRTTDTVCLLRSVSCAFTGS